MSLATRCAACGTVFRVVHDQLKVSDGWVRCGRCEQVFNASDALFELDAAERPDASPAVNGATGHGAQAAAVPSLETTPVEAQAPAARADEAAGDSVDATQAAAGNEEPTAESKATEAGNDADAGANGGTAADDADGSDTTPSFVRQAEIEAQRAERWQQPRVRRGLMAAAGVLALWAVLQVATALRDPLAARWPSSRPLLASLCVLSGCKVEALRNLDGLAVESSGLVRIEGASLFRLSVVLRNRESRSLLLPALDLTLTDTQGSVVARKVLDAAQLGAAQPDIEAGQELSLQGLLDTGTPRVDGYSIALFYP